MADEIAEMRKALRCLYIAVDQSVARDVEQKCEAALRAAVAEATAPLQAEIERLRQACEIAKFATTGLGAEPTNLVHRALWQRLKDAHEAVSLALKIGPSSTQEAPK